MKANGKEPSSSYGGNEFVINIDSQHDDRRKPLFCFDFSRQKLPMKFHSSAEFRCQSVQQSENVGCLLETGSHSVVSGPEFQSSVGCFIISWRDQINFRNLMVQRVMLAAVRTFSKSSLLR
jgi:hypothetical protein